MHRFQGFSSKWNSVLAVCDFTEWSEMCYQKGTIYVKINKDMKINK